MSEEEREDRHKGVLEHMSCTKFDMVLRCEYAFFQRYVLGVKSRPSGALVFGRADDETKNGVYQEKIRSGETAATGECRERFAAEFEKAADGVEGGVEWGDDDRGELKDTGVRLISAWRDGIAVKTKPVSVQNEFHVPIRYSLPESPATEFDFMGYLDLVQEAAAPGALGSPPGAGTRRVVTDNKTSGRRWGASNAAGTTQGVGYGVAAEHDPALRELGVDPAEVHFHVAVKTKTPQVQHPDDDPALVRHTDQAERDGFVKMLAKAHLKVATNLKSGNWMPNRGNFLCSKKWCGYWRECQAEHGGVIKD